MGKDARLLRLSAAGSAAAPGRGQVKPVCRVSRESGWRCPKRAAPSAGGCAHLALRSDSGSEAAIKARGPVLADPANSTQGPAGAISGGLAWGGEGRGSVRAGCALTAIFMMIRV